MIRRGAPLAERLAVYSKAAESGCIEWTAATDKNGYGKTQVGGRLVRAHRLAYELARGAIPAGKLVRHTCDNPPCINPDHLVLGDEQLNAEDRVQRDRFDRESGRYNRVKLNMASAREIRRKAASGVLHRQLADEYGVGRDQISRVVNHINWKEPSVDTAIITIEQAVGKFGVDVDEHLDRQADIPIIEGLQAQGDVAVVPDRMCGGQLTAATTPVPRAGYPVVRGEAGANTHLLLAQGECFYDAARPGEEDLGLGVLTVPVDSVAYLAHPEHGFAGIAPGTYELRRQREQADVIRLVQD